MSLECKTKEYNIITEYSSIHKLEYLPYEGHFQLSIHLSNAAGSDDEFYMSYRISRNESGDIDTIYIFGGPNIYIGMNLSELDRAPEWIHGHIVKKIESKLISGTQYYYIHTTSIF